MCKYCDGFILDKRKIKNFFVDKNKIKISFRKKYNYNCYVVDHILSTFPSLNRFPYQHITCAIWIIFKVEWNN